MFSGPMSAGSQLDLVQEGSGGSLENRREGEVGVFLSLSLSTGWYLWQLLPLFPWLQLSQETCHSSCFLLGNSRPRASWVASPPPFVPPAWEWRRLPAMVSLWIASLSLVWVLSFFHLSALNFLCFKYSEWFLSSWLGTDTKKQKGVWNKNEWGTRI